MKRKVENEGVYTVVEEDTTQSHLPTSWSNKWHLRQTTNLLGLFQLFLVILFATVTDSNEVLDPITAQGTGSEGYNFFIGVEIMMFIGFGYLMTFQKWYGLGAVGLTMMVTALGLQWAVFTESFFDQIMNNPTGSGWHLVRFNIFSMLSALYAISAVLITFGAVIGKLSPFQLIALTIVELFFQSMNYKVFMSGALNVADMGGTYLCHMFGAYFGLAVAYMLGKPQSEPIVGTTPDIFALIGTVR